MKELRRLSLALVGATCLTLAPASAASVPCECGFAVQSSSPDGPPTVFTDMLETDFLHLRNMSQTPDWQVQEYNVTQKKARGPFGKLASRHNVLANPYEDDYSWNGSSVRGGDAGMQLWVRGKSVEGMIGMGEVAAERDDMLFGTFRVGMKLTGVRGTCGAFFWFRNDSEEIDMEFLSKQFKTSEDVVNLVLQSPASLEAGYDASGTPNFAVTPLPFNPDKAFHEYRFDWTPGKVSFFADGRWLRDMTADAPENPGRLILNHWSNGDPAWSAGPPDSDAVMTVSYVKAYFNSSSPERIARYEEMCAGDNALSRVCVIPDQTFAPDPDGENGNKTARTPFFSRPDDIIWEDVRNGNYSTTTSSSTETPPAADSTSSSAAHALKTWTMNYYTLAGLMSVWVATFAHPEQMMVWPVFF